MPPFPRPFLAFIARFNRAEYWASHESLEELWRENRSSFYHGLILYASALVHLERRNAHGVLAQLSKAIPLLERFTPAYLGLDVQLILDHAERLRKRAGKRPRALTADRSWLPAPPRLVAKPSLLRGTEPELRGTFDPDRLTQEIDRELRGLATLQTARLRQLRREFSRRLVKAPAVTVVDLAERLLRLGPSHRFIGYELVLTHSAALRSLRAGQLARLASGMNDWAAVDTFACYLAGPAWREHQVSDTLIRRWAASPERWWRRTALVCTVALNCAARGGRGDTTRTLMVCGLLVADRDDMVVKAMSWALRELAKRDASAVRRFLVEHQETLATRVRREVGNKLRTGLKNPRGRTRR